MSLLPSGFDALEPFVKDWAIEGAARRAHRRTASSDTERHAFFETSKPLIGPALAWLDARAWSEHDPADRRLMNLCLAFAHIAQAVEIQRDDEAKHAPYRETMRITRAPADD